jgi:hypothetical protein
MNAKFNPKTTNDSCGSSRTRFTAISAQWRAKVASFSMLAAVPGFLGSTFHDARAETRPDDLLSLAGQRAAAGRARWLKSGPGKFQSPSTSALSPTGGDDNCPGRPVPLGVYTAASPYTDTGDTTGGNSTVSYLDFYYYVQNSFGPDHVYTFTLTERGPNPRIEITAANPSSYKPMISIASGYYGYLECRAGTDNYLWYPYYDDVRTGGDGIISLADMPLNTRLFVYIDSQLNDSLGSGAYTFKMQDVTVGDAPPAAPFDFDGSTRSDPSLFRPSNSVWYNFAQEGSPTSGGTRFGLPTDKLVPGDYDDDGKTDIAIFRDGQWWWINSRDDTLSVVQFGLAGDTPVPADYTGDGRDEIAIYRDGVWWSLDLTSFEATAIQFGLALDKPVPADYDGDRKKDRAIFRDGTWWILKSAGGYYAQQWGLSTDKLVPADYDGDRKVDLAVFRNGEWYVLRSTGGYDIHRWGTGGDIPVPGYYDYYDARAQRTFYREGRWGMFTPGVGTSEFTFGQIGDIPVPAAYLR